MRIYVNPPKNLYRFSGDKDFIYYGTMVEFKPTEIPIMNLPKSTISILKVY